MSEQIKKRESTLPKGKDGEDLACEHLQKKGFHIVERNVRFKIAEIDIVAREGNVLVFVEVRSRKSDVFGTPKASVGRTKQWHLVKAAQAYLQRLNGKMPVCRFDVVSVLGYGSRASVEHIRDAFRMSVEPTRARGQGPWQPF